MTIVRAKPTGYTDDIDVVAASELNAIDVNTTRALDGVGGGNYSPAAVVGIGGGGLQLTQTAGAASNVQLTSRSIVRHQPISGVGSTISANWSQHTTTLWRNTASGGLLWIPLTRMPHNQRLQEVHLRWQGAAGHGGLPTMPAFDLLQIDQNGAQVNLGTATDASGGVAAYEAAHDISLTALAHTIDMTASRYLVEITGETGGNFVANAVALSLRIVVDCTSYTEF